MSESGQNSEVSTRWDQVRFDAIGPWRSVGPCTWSSWRKSGRSRPTSGFIPTTTIGDDGADAAPPNA